MKIKDLVEAIRKDPICGRGTCSTAEECWTDEELANAILEYKILCVPEAIGFARGLGDTDEPIA